MDTPDKEGNEFFSVIDGKKQDAHLHAELLDGADPKATDALARQNCRDLGYPEDFIERNFGPEGAA